MAAAAQAGERAGLMEGTKEATAAWLAAKGAGSRKRGP